MTRDAVRTRIADIAIDLFAEHGFDRVTVDQIATAAGISTRSFNRYFPVKEDTVMGDAELWGATIRDAFIARPSEESAWDSLHWAFDSMLASSQVDAVREKKMLLVLVGAPTLRARHLEKHQSWAGLLVPLVRERLTGDDTEVRAEAIVHAAMACFDVAVMSWARAEEDRPAREILRIAFDARLVSA